MEEDYLPETEYSNAYRSEYLDTLGTPTSEVWELLAALPCSYVESPSSIAPTILALKRHAQSICALLQFLLPPTEPGPLGTSDFKDGQALDFLNDLSTPYQNGSDDHNRPITTLLNNLKAPARGRKRPVDVCPLHRHEVADLDRTVALPHATHHKLLKHANECLERLDHDYSASGGIMSILPIDRTNASAVQIMADSTLIGQMLTSMQGLVVRNRELEICLDDMRGLVAGQSLVPREILAELGAVGRLGTKIESYPQDRFVVADVTQEKWTWLCDELDRQDLREGTQTVSIVTSYTRLRGQTTVFIAFETLLRRRADVTGPAVVKVVMPKWPERTTAWEERHEEGLESARAMKGEYFALQRKVERLESDAKVLEQEQKQLRLWRLISMEDEDRWSDAERRFAWEMQEREQNDRKKQIDEAEKKLMVEEAMLKRKREEYEQMYPDATVV